MFSNSFGFVWFLAGKLNGKVVSLVLSGVPEVQSLKTAKVVSLLETLDAFARTRHSDVVGVAPLYRTTLLRG